MKTICFYFQIHQPQRLKQYRFFNIGNDHYYYDDYANEDVLHQMAEVSFVPANRLLLEMIQENKGKFKVAFSISGVALDQMEFYAPEVIDGFRQLADTGCVEFLSETHAHSLSSLIDPEEFKLQVEEHDKKIESLFGLKPKVFRNTELIYSDEIAAQVEAMGFEGMMAEGAKHLLGWKSPNYVYQSAGSNLKLLLRNSKLSDDMATRFSNYTWDEYPLTADKYMRWIAETPKEEKVFNLFMNYEVLGNFQKKSSGIFDFMKALPRFAEENHISFSTPSEVIKAHKPTGVLSVPHPVSWVDEERDTSAWLGNSLQQEAFNRLYELGERVRMSENRTLRQDWSYLQCSDHFYYMGTKQALPFSPFGSPFEAFSIYMNAMSDFIERVEAEFPISIENEELNSLLTTIHNQADEINRLKHELKTQATVVVDPVNKETKVVAQSKAKKAKVKAK